MYNGRKRRTGRKLRRKGQFGTHAPRRSELPPRPRAVDDNEGGGILPFRRRSRRGGRVRRDGGNVVRSPALIRTSPRRRRPPPPPPPEGGRKAGRRVSFQGNTYRTQDGEEEEKREHGHIPRRVTASGDVAFVAIVAVVAVPVMAEWMR